MKNKLLKKPKINSKGCKVDKNKTATTRHLTRILVYLSCVECANITKIVKSTGLTNTHCRDALNFLLNNKIVFIIKINEYRKKEVKFYRINPFFVRG